MTLVELVDVVDHNDRVVGVAPRAELRDAGLNYRVVHVLLTDARGELLLQQVSNSDVRGFTHGSSAAGHVRTGESYARAAARELREELGVDSALVPLGKTWLDEDRCRKFIGVFLGRADGPFAIDPAEVAGVEAMAIPQVRTRVRQTSNQFSPTFRRVFRFADGVDAWGRLR